MSALRATILIAIFSVLSKILGLLRVVVFANRLGAGEEFDIYVAAFRLPDFIFNLLILGTLSVAFIPVFVEYLQKNKEEAVKIASTFFNFAFLIMGALAVLGILFSDFLVKVIVPGFDAVAQAQTSDLTKILMLSPLFFALSSVLTSILHSHKRFLFAAIAPLFYNLSIIFGVLFFYPKYGLWGLGLGVIIGAFLHMILQLPGALALGLRPFAYLDLKNEGVKRIGRLFLPRIIGMDLGQISLLAAAVLGSFFASGTLSVFYIAYDLVTVPVGVFAVSFAIAAFPALSELAGRGDKQALRNFFSTTTVQILFLIIPISVLMLLLRAQIVRLIPGAIQGTKFTFEDTRLTAQTLGFFVLSLFAQSLVPLLSRSFYAMQNTIIPVVSGLIGGVLNVGLAIILSRLYRGPESFALAFTIAITVHLLIMFMILHRRLRGLDDEFLFVRIIKISIASVIMGIVTFLVLYIVAPLVNMQTYLGIFLQTISALAVASITYLGAGLLIKLPETKQLVIILRSWFSKFTKPLTSAIVNMFTDLR